MTERPANWLKKSLPGSDAMIAVIMERQLTLHQETKQILGRIERKVDAVPERVKRTWTITLIGTWFGDTHSKILWLALILILTGHISLEQLLQKILQ